jgi:hypothetical protein
MQAGITAWLEWQLLYRQEAGLQAHDGNPHPKTFDDLTGADFRRFAALGLTVHSNPSLSDQGLPAPSAFRHAGKLEQVTEFDIFAFKRDFNGLHRDFQK